MSGEPNTLAGRVRRSLSAKLLLLTILCVLLAEAVVLVPSIANERLNFLQERIEAAYLVGLALEAPGEEMIGEGTAAQLFRTAGILGVTVMREDARMLITAPDVDADADRPMHHIELATLNPFLTIGEAWHTMFSRGDDMLRVVGEPTYASEQVDIIVSEAALRRRLHAYARNILGLSLLISTLTGVFVYSRLHALIVAPVKRLTRNMTAFQDDPEAAAPISPSARADEIGVAERTLAALEGRTQELLGQRRRLAALGAGIAKISHDLRNILASAQLMSDRLAKSEDPRVKKLTPRLVGALDRAIALSRDTLSYGRMEPAALSKAPVDLRALVEDVFEDQAAMQVAFVNDVADGLTIVADRNALYRALGNLVKNAVEAMAPQPAAADGPPPTDEKRVVVAAEAGPGFVAIRVRDTGPGLSDEARAHLFEPFRGSSKSGGSGLGVAIAHEIARAHGGTLALEHSGPDGAVFRLTLPQ
jgi:signal transduction histidine kinase